MLLLSLQEVFRRKKCQNYGTIELKFLQEKKPQIEVIKKQS